MIPDDILGEQSQGTVSVPRRQKEDSQLPEERESGSLKTRKQKGESAVKSQERKVSSASDYYIFVPSRTAQRIFLYPLQCGFFCYEPGYTLSRQSFDSFLLMYIQKGEMELDYEGKMQTIPEKSLVLLDCYRPHGYTTRGGAECLWLHFDGNMARDYYAMIAERLGPVFSMEDAYPVLSRMRSILKLFEGKRPVQEALLHRHITDILTECMLYQPSHAPVRSEGKIAEQATSYMNEHFSEDLSLNMIAGAVGLSTYYFSRVFRKETGYTPHEYLVSRRMASARYLLRHTQLSLREICEQTGFSSESVFCNAFKKQHGMTAQDYRNNDRDSSTAT